MARLINIGCCAFNFRWLPLAESLQLVRNLGFHVVDVGANTATAQVNQLLAAEEPEATGTTIRRLAEQTELRLSELFVTSIWVHGRPTATNHPDPAVRHQLLAQFRRLCRCAAVAGFESIMGTPGVPQPELDPAAAWEVAVEMLTQMVAVAQVEGVTFHVEPHKDSLVEQPALALQMAQDVSGLRYTLDYAHFIGQGIPQQEIEPLHAYAGHLHAKPAAPGIFKCLIDEGTINYGAMVTDLAKRHWNGVIAIEYMGDQTVPHLAAHPAFQSVLLAHALTRAQDKAGVIEHTDEI